MRNPPQLRPFPANWPPGSFLQPHQGDGARISCAQGTTAPCISRLPLARSAPRPAALPVDTAHTSPPALEPGTAATLDQRRRPPVPLPLQINARARAPRRARTRVFRAPRRPSRWPPDQLPPVITEPLPTSLCRSTLLVRRPGLVALVRPPSQLLRRPTRLTIAAPARQSRRYHAPAAASTTVDAPSSLSHAPDAVRADGPIPPPPWPREPWPGLSSPALGPEHHPWSHSAAPGRSRHPPPGRQITDQASPT